MKQEVLFTTAFFDINRSNWKSYSRSNTSYVEYFKTWAGIDNQLVAYFNSQEVADEVMKIRTECGRKDKTKVIVVDPFEIYSDLYNRTEKVAEDKIQQDFHVRTDSPESKNAKYVYIMFFKAWCMANSAKLFPEYKTSCWIDFGFGRGHDIFEDSRDFNFSYQIEPLDKIYFQPLKNIKSIPPVFDLARTGDTFICGGFFIGPTNSWDYFLAESKKYYEALLYCGFIDDDQTIWGMFYQNNPDKTALFPAGNYYDGFCKLSEHDFHFTKSRKEESFYSKLVYKIIAIRQILAYSFRTFRYLNKTKTKQ